MKVENTDSNRHNLSSGRRSYIICNNQLLSRESRASLNNVTWFILVVKQSPINKIYFLLIISITARNAIVSVNTTAPPCKDYILIAIINC